MLSLLLVRMLITYCLHLQRVNDGWLAEPVERGQQMSHGEERARRFVVARGKGAGFFEAAEEAFHFRAVGVEVFVVRSLVQAVSFGGNNGFSPEVGDGLQAFVRIVGFVRYHGPRRVGQRGQ